MPLFGPIGVGLANALFGLNTPASGFELQSGMQPPFSFPYGYSFVPSTPPPATTPAATPAPIPAAPAAPPPPMQSIGTFTTRRTQLFGPLGAVSI